MQDLHARLISSLVLGLAVGCASTNAAHELDARAAVVDPDLPVMASGTAPSSPITVQDVAVAEEDSWQSIGILYAWGVGLDGDVTVRGRKADVDYDLDEILDDLDFGIMAHVEAWQDTWGLFFDPMQLNVTRDGSAGPGGNVDVDADVKLTVMELGGFYRLSDGTSANGRRTMIDVLGGLRYADVDGDLDFAVGPLAGKVRESQDWLDPIIGARLITDLSEKWVLTLRGDVGGFDLNDNTSDFAWNAQAFLGRRLGSSASFWLGYKILDIDYDDGGGNDRFEWDIRAEGPAAGIGVGF